MPALRLTSRRRRSSHALFTPAKAGIYGIPSRPVTFAPNVTPITYTEVDPEDDPTNPLSSYALSLAAGGDGTNTNGAQSLMSKLFPPSETPAPPPTRKRCPPGKRRSQGYIPRPPNAFMLFRADFVRQKHVPGSIETNHGSLSKIIGTCWRQLPLEEKRVWEVKAKQEKAAHKAMFPDYRFRPVHNKNKNASSSSPNSSSPSSNSHSTNVHSNDRDDIKRKEKQPTTAEDERRCDEVAQLLLEGKKGEELARAVRNLDRARSMERERELEMEEYELGLGLGLGGDEAQESRRQSYDFGGQEQHEEMGTLHMPVSQHPHAFGSYATSFMHHGMGPSSGMHMHMNTNMSAAYHRRSSSVPLPNEWQAQPYLSSSTSFHPSSNAIAIPSVPQFMSRPVSPVGSIARFNHAFPPHHQQEQQFMNSFHQQQSFAPSPATPNTGEYTFAPIPEYTPSFHSHTQMFHPTPIPQPLMPFMTQTTPRSSLGLGQRRASSAQPLLMRSWTMPSDFDYSSIGMGMNMERDPSPLPEVESGLFADFSFGGSSSSSHSMGGEEESQHSKPASACGEDQIDPSSPGTGPGLGHGLSIAPTSLARIDTSVSLSYSPTAVPPSSISTSTASSSCSPVTSVDVLPEMSFNRDPTPAASSNSAENVNANIDANGNGTGTGRMDSLDMSAYMHLDGLYADSSSSVGPSYAMGMYDNSSQHDSHQHQQQQQQVYAEGYSMNMGYYEYEVDPVVKTHSQEVYQGGAYFETTT